MEKPRYAYRLCVSSETLMPSIEDVYVVEEIRKRRNPKPSDHAPVVCVVK